MKTWYSIIFIVIGSFTITFAQDVQELNETIQIQEDLTRGAKRFGRVLCSNEKYLVVSTSSKKGPNSYAGNGNIYIYLEASKGEIKLDTILTPPRFVKNIMFGYSVAMDENTLFIGAADEDLKGVVYVYSRDEDEWSFKYKLSGSKSVEGERFGSEINVKNGILVISSSRKEKVHIFIESEGVYIEKDVILNPSNQEDTNFGSEVEIAGNNILIGDNYYTHDSIRSAGIVYRYILNEGRSALKEVIISPNPVPGGNFGSSLSSNKNQIIIAEDGSNYGNVYVYERNKDLIVFKEKLLRINMQRGDDFGRKILLSDSVLAVSAIYHNHEDIDNEGAVFLYQMVNSSWKNTHLLRGSDCAEFEGFGWSLSMFNDKIVSSTFDLNKNEKQKGETKKVYLFEIN